MRQQERHCTVETPPVFLCRDVAPKQHDDELKVTARPKIWHHWKFVDDPLRLTYTETGKPFPVTVKARTCRNNNDHIILRDKEGRSIAVLIKKRKGFPKLYTLYSFQPLVQGQQPSYRGKSNVLPSFYKWGTISSEEPKDAAYARCFSLRLEDGTVFMAFSVEDTMRGRYMYEVKQGGNTCAEFKQARARFGTQGKPWTISASPAVDICLMIAFAAVLNDNIEF